MPTNGVDSASGPSLAQAQQAKSQGVSFWAWYCGGPGAFHVWTDAEVSVLTQASFTSSLPIWVPKLDLSGDPHADYRTARARVIALGWTPVIALDTEASMRGNPNLGPYVNGWCYEAAIHGDPQVVYGGANYVGTAHPWWIIAGTPPPGKAYQTGQSNIGGVQVDTDIAGDGFPLSVRAATPQAPQPAPQPVVYHLTIGGVPMATQLITVPLGPDGTGDYPVCPVEKFGSLSSYAEHDEWAGDKDNITTEATLHIFDGVMHVLVRGGTPGGQAHAWVSVAD